MASPQKGSWRQPAQGKRSEGVEIVPITACGLTLYLREEPVTTFASVMVMTVPALIENYFLFIGSLISVHLNKYTLCVYYVEFTEYVFSE